MDACSVCKVFEACKKWQEHGQDDPENNPMPSDEDSACMQGRES